MPAPHTKPASRVIVVDAHEVVRRGVIELLQSDGDIVVIGEAASAAGALRIVRAKQPDLVLLDVNLPDGDGIELCEAIRTEFPAVRCVMLTESSDRRHVVGAVEAGASGYLLKSMGLRPMCDGVRSILHGNSLIDPTVAGRILDHLRKQHENSALLSTLDADDRQIVALLAEGMSNREISQVLGIAEKTAKNHVSALLRKLNMRNRTQAAVFGADVYRSLSTVPNSSVPSSPRATRNGRASASREPRRTLRTTQEAAAVT